MKKLLSIALLASFQMVSFGQNSLRVWDFEDPCPDPNDAFHLNCIPYAQSASGTPDTRSNYIGVAPVFGSSKYAHMYARYCPNDPIKYHSEGILLNYAFTAGRIYRINYLIRSEDQVSPETKLVLVNNMPNAGGYENVPQCEGTLDALPDIPANSQVIKTHNEGEISQFLWMQQTFSFTSTGNFNQLWFRPQGADPDAILPGIYLDIVSVRDNCAWQDNATVCRYPEIPGTAFVHLSAGSVQWQLVSALNCSDGIQISNFGSLVPINWQQGNNSFTLPLNSGCYILIGTAISGSCDGQTYAFWINTRADAVPVCNDRCENWTLQMSNPPCDEPYFWVSLNDNGAEWFPETTFSFSVDGVVRQTGNYTEFDYIHPSLGWHELCVTVNQPECPPIRKCKTFYVECELGGGFAGDQTQSRGKKETTEKTDLRISNPSSGTIWFSGPVESGTAYLYSMLGGLIKSFTLDGADRLDVSDVATGQYLLNIRRPGDSISKLVLINHSN